MNRTATQERDIFGTDPRELDQQIRMLRRYACALVGNLADADDLVQETLKRALTYSDRGAEIRNLRSYLLTMLHNVRVDSVKRQIRAGDPVDLDETLPLAITPSQNDYLVCKEVTDAISSLSADQREVLLLVGLEGVSYRDAAEILAVPVGTIMSRLCRGRRALREALGYENVEIEAAVLTCRPGRSIAEANTFTDFLSRAA